MTEGSLEKYIRVMIYIMNLIIGNYQLFSFPIIDISAYIIILTVLPTITVFILSTIVGRIWEN